MDFQALAEHCAPTVHPFTMTAVARVESGFNPFAIGVVGGRLVRQPVNKLEAVATAIELGNAGFNFSLGVSQINRHNLSRLGLDYTSAFDPCDNVRAGAKVLSDCFARAKTPLTGDQQALQAAFSCYYSGNFSTGFKPDFARTAQLRAEGTCRSPAGRAGHGLGRHPGDPNHPGPASRSRPCGHTNADHPDRNRRDGRAIRERLQQLDRPRVGFPVMRAAAVEPGAKSSRRKPDE